MPKQQKSCENYKERQESDNYKFRIDVGHVLVLDPDVHTSVPLQV